MDIATTFIVIIVTALTNVLKITGLGNYFKRGIERSFDEKMEDYKAEIQKSLGEHQVRFVRNHEKAVFIP